MKKTVAIFMVLVTLLGLCGCQNAAASVVEKTIEKLSSQELSLDTGKALKSLEEMLMKLPEEEREKLQNLEILDKLKAEYEKLEAAAIQKMEEQIAQLMVEQLSEEQVEAARKALDKLPEEVREKISNVGVLEEAEKALNQMP